MPLNSARRRQDRLAAIVARNAPYARRRRAAANRRPKITLTVGVQADTRITDKDTKPDCPFPAKLELVPPMDNGRLVVGVPIDVPFTELNKLMEAQFKGHRFPEDGGAPYEIEVLSAKSPPPATGC